MQVTLDCEQKVFLSGILIGGNCDDFIRKIDSCSHPTQRAEDSTTLRRPEAGAGNRNADYRRNLKGVA